MVPRAKLRGLRDRIGREENPDAAIERSVPDLGCFEAGATRTQHSRNERTGIDCGLYVETFLLAAQSLGLGAVPQAAFAAHSDFVCDLSFGYPDPEHAANGFRTSRADLRDTFKWVDA